MSEVSGPGVYSQRTDMGAMGGVMNPNSPTYGEVADLQQLKQGAPLAGGSTPPGAGPTGGGNPLADITPLDAPSRYPDQPVTAGATAVPGPPPSAHDEDRAAAQDIPEGLLMTLIRQASQPGASPSFQKYVRQLYSNR